VSNSDVSKDKMLKVYYTSKAYPNLFAGNIFFNSPRFTNLTSRIIKRIYYDILIYNSIDELIDTVHGTEIGYIYPRTKSKYKYTGYDFYNTNIDYFVIANIKIITDNDDIIAIKTDELIVLN